MLQLCCVCSTNRNNKWFLSSSDSRIGLSVPLKSNVENHTQRWEGSPHPSFTLIRLHPIEDPIGCDLHRATTLIPLSSVSFVAVCYELA